MCRHASAAWVEHMHDIPANYTYWINDSINIFCEHVGRSWCLVNAEVYCTAERGLSEFDGPRSLMIIKSIHQVVLSTACMGTRRTCRAQLWCSLQRGELRIYLLFIAIVFSFVICDCETIFRFGIELYRSWSLLRQLPSCNIAIAIQLFIAPLQSQQLLLNFTKQRLCCNN
jgi:hypothetical protein